MTPEVGSNSATMEAPKPVTAKAPGSGKTVVKPKKQAVAKPAKVAVKKKAAPPAKPTKEKKAKPAQVAEHDGTVVGYEAKKQEDVKWSATKVAFYKALKKIGGSGTSAQIAKASNEKINEGHARHFGYHGVGGGLTKVEDIEDVRGFTFTLTAKGRSIDPDAELKKQEEAKEKAKAKAAK